MVLAQRDERDRSLDDLGDLAVRAAAALGRECGEQLRVILVARRRVEQHGTHASFMEQRDLSVAIPRRIGLTLEVLRRGGKIEDVLSAVEAFRRRNSLLICGDRVRSSCDGTQRGLSFSGSARRPLPGYTTRRLGSVPANAILLVAASNASIAIRISRRASASPRHR